MRGARARARRPRPEGRNEPDRRAEATRPEAAGQLALAGQGGGLRPAVHRAAGRRLRLLLAIPGAGHRQGARGRDEAEGYVPREEEARGEPRRVQAAARGDRAVVRRAPQAAAQQERDGRAPDRHQPGGPRPRPRVRSLQARRHGELHRVLCRAAGVDQGRRQLSRPGRVRQRRREDAADRAAHGPQARPAEPERPDLDGGRRQDLPLPRRGRSREAAQGLQEEAGRQVMKRLLIPIAAAALLGGCSSEMDELKQFVRDSDKGLPRRIDPLPAVKPFEPFTYEGFDLPDPFKPRKLSAPKEGSGGGLAPDLNRRKEPLEAFPLEQLKMVGTLSQGNDIYALVRADKTLYRVKKGNYMGQNFGLITDVTDSEIKLKEIVQDSAGDWAERQSVLPLLEEPGKGGSK